MATQERGSASAAQGRGEGAPRGLVLATPVGAALALCLRTPEFTSSTAALLSGAAQTSFSAGRSGLAGEQHWEGTR